MNIFFPTEYEILDETFFLTNFEKTQWEINSIIWLRYHLNKILRVIWKTHRHCRAVTESKSLLQIKSTFYTQII